MPDRECTFYNQGSSGPGHSQLSVHWTEPRAARSDYYKAPSGRLATFRMTLDRDKMAVDCLLDAEQITKLIAVLRATQAGAEMQSIVKWSCK